MIINEFTVTKNLYTYLLWKRSQQIVTHQFSTMFGIADVFSITDKMISSEYEIKLTKQDLLSELTPIKEISSGKINGEGSKWEKHLKYLTGIYHGSIDYPGRNPLWKLSDKSFGDKSVPNNFYFVVPEDLAELANEYLKGTKYGILTFHTYGRNSEYMTFHSYKKVGKLHNNKCPESFIMKLAHRMSYICEKLVNHDSIKSAQDINY